MTGPHIMILAGGTGGHIFPGLAVAAALRAQHAKVSWMGAEGAMETRLVPTHDIPLHTLQIASWRGSGVVRMLRAPWQLLAAVIAAMQILRTLRPNAVISFGGFAAGPGGLAAWLLRTPLLVHEQNRAPGLTNRVLARLARRVLCGFPQSFGVREEYVGNPVRAEIFNLPAPAERSPQRAVVSILVMGGSQGAASLNKRLPAALGQLATAVHICHQSGTRHVDVTRAAYAAVGLTADVVGFLEDMPATYAQADIVICRAGASTLAELCAAGVCSVLVPLPTAADDHQTRNADFLCEQGAAVLVPEGDNFEQRIGEAVALLVADRQRRLEMADAAKRLARPLAARHVAEACLSEVSI
ncbi:MAG: undecaprenyldiphospho-muramoylpentapeptide beta-N-acetylglucosaminyltransferase [Aquimonas sp.]|nr:undecaprenyldiphospho-muramoylpentapeptide beta-N-acetylglucosaminyltransferase [Aquimonas sp.]